MIAWPDVRKVQIGAATLYHGDCMEIIPTLGSVKHWISDPPYEEIMHAAKAKGRKLRTDGAEELKPLGFASIDAIRTPFVTMGSMWCEGWFIMFCTPEGVAKWADVINASPIIAGTSSA